MVMYVSHWGFGCLLWSCDFHHICPNNNIICISALLLDKRKQLYFVQDHHVERTEKQTFKVHIFYISLFLCSRPLHYMDLHLTPDLTQHLSSSHCHTLSLSHMARSHVSRAHVCYIHTGEETERGTKSMTEQTHTETETTSELAFNGMKSYCPWRSPQRENLRWLHQSGWMKP